MSKHTLPATIFAKDLYHHTSCQKEFKVHKGIPHSKLLITIQENNTQSRRQSVYKPETVIQNGDNCSYPGCQEENDWVPLFVIMALEQGRIGKQQKYNVTKTCPKILFLVHKHQQLASRELMNKGQG